VCRYLLEESARVAVYDPKVPKAQIVADLTEHDPSQRNIDRGAVPAPTLLFSCARAYGGGGGRGAAVHKLVTFAGSAMEAVDGADALIVCTEWDEFKTLDYAAVYQKMNKPAFIFDGRLVLDGPALKKLGFHVQTIGKTFM
jgi:UDPglucose 6-dehydrogenase